MRALIIANDAALFDRIRLHDAERFGHARMAMAPTETEVLGTRLLFTDQISEELSLAAREVFAWKDGEIVPLKWPAT